MDVSGCVYVCLQVSVWCAGNPAARVWADDEHRWHIDLSSLAQDVGLFRQMQHRLVSPAVMSVSSVVRRWHADSSRTCTDVAQTMYRRAACERQSTEWSHEGLLATSSLWALQLYDSCVLWLLYSCPLGSTQDWLVFWLQLFVYFFLSLCMLCHQVIHCLLLFCFSSFFIHFSFDLMQ